MGLLWQTPDASKQCPHTDGAFFSMFVSRSDDTKIHFYPPKTEAHGVVEITINIPKQYVLFFASDVAHCGAQYPHQVLGDDDDLHRARVFGYVSGWPEHMQVYDAYEGWTKDEMCAQQGFDPREYQLKKVPE